VWRNKCSPFCPRSGDAGCSSGRVWSSGAQGVVVVAEAVICVWSFCPSSLSSSTRGGFWPRRRGSGGGAVLLRRFAGGCCRLYRSLSAVPCCLLAGRLAGFGRDVRPDRRTVPGRCPRRRGYRRLQIPPFATGGLCGDSNEVFPLQVRSGDTAAAGIVFVLLFGGATAADGAAADLFLQSWSQGLTCIFSFSRVLSAYVGTAVLFLDTSCTLVFLT
jgi:hypothetical protein